MSKKALSQCETISSAARNLIHTIVAGMSSTGLGLGNMTEVIGRVGPRLVSCLVWWQVWLFQATTQNVCIWLTLDNTNICLSEIVKLKWAFIGHPGCAAMESMIFNNY